MKALTKYSLYALLGIATFTSFALAEGTPQTCAPKGFTIGAQMGYSTATADTRRTLSNGQSDRHRLGANSLLGGFSVGYIFSMPKIWFHPEISGNFNKSKYRFNNVSGGVQESFCVKGSDLWNVSLRTGMRFFGSMPFLKVGLANSRFKASSKSLNTPTSASKNSRLSGFDLGLGVNFPISQRVITGVEYEHVWFGNLNINHANTASYRFRPMSDSVLASFKFVI